MTNNVAYQKNDSKVAFVFSCPGQCEEKANNVCSGLTGKNLNDMLGYCHRKLPDIFTSGNKDDYMITNAVTKVYYQSLNGKTEATDAAILEKTNQDRLFNELNECDFIIAMGDKAKTAIERLPVQGKKIYSEHLSPRHLNFTYESDMDTPSARRHDILQHIADKIIDAICKGEMQPSEYRSDKL